VNRSRPLCLPLLFLHFPIWEVHVQLYRSRKGSNNA
jgi:hypothetical protein